jgi:hypothetical protein
MKRSLVGKIFGIALVFVMIGTLVRGLRGALNARAAMIQVAQMKRQVSKYALKKGGKTGLTTN